MITAVDPVDQMVVIEICSLIGWRWIIRFFKLQKDHRKRVAMEIAIDPEGCTVLAG
jgi:hypothetical protein